MTLLSRRITTRAHGSAAGLLLIVCLLLGGCSAPESGSTLNRGLGPEPDSIDPHHAGTSQAHNVLRDLFEGLVAYSADGALVPGAAEHYQVSDDGLTYTFWLREQAAWSNGDPLTAGDFVYSYRRLVDPGTAAYYAEHLVALENAAAIVAGDLPTETLGARALDDRRLQLKLSQPVPYFVALLALPPAFPVHAASLAEHGKQFARAGKLVSNGAYRLQDWQLGSYLELRRNPHYWNAANTRIERVRHHVTIETSGELYRYRAGELDITENVPSEAFAQLRAERPAELRVAPRLGVYFYGLNMTKDKLAAAPALRRALSMAIDRDVLTDKVTGRGELPAYSWVPPGVYNYEPPQFRYARIPADERHAMARRLYREAGYDADTPLEIELRYNTSEAQERIALAVQSMWREVLGFEAELVNEEFKVLVNNVRTGELTEVFRLTWNGDYNDAYTFLAIFESGNPSNLTGYRSEQYDALLASAAAQIDPQRRRLFLEEAETVLLNDHPVIPLYFHVSKHLVSPRVAGWQDNVLDFHYSQHLSLRDRNND